MILYRTRVLSIVHCKKEKSVFRKFVLKFSCSTDLLEQCAYCSLSSSKTTLSNSLTNIGEFLAIKTGQVLKLCMAPTFSLFRYYFSLFPFSYIHISRQMCIMCNLLNSFLIIAWSIKTISGINITIHFASFFIKNDGFPRYSLKFPRRKFKISEKLYKFNLLFLD